MNKNLITKKPKPSYESVKIIEKRRTTTHRSENYPFFQQQNFNKQIINKTTTTLVQ